MSRPPGSPYPALVLAVACVSTAAVLVRIADAPALAVAFGRLALASILLAPFAAPAARRSWPGLTGPQRLAVLGSGVALAVHFATWIASLSYTSIASASLLVNTAPLFTLAMSWLVLRERPRASLVAAILLALAGVTLIGWADWTGSPGSIYGNALAVCGAVALAAYQVVGRGLRSALPLRAYVLAVWGTGAAGLGLLCAATGTALAGHSTGTLAAVLGLALLPTLAGHGLVNRSLRLLPAPTVGLFLLGEPVGASLLAFLLFGEVPGPATWTGGAVILAALALVILTEER